MHRYKKPLLSVLLLLLAPLAAQAQVPELAPLQHTARYDIRFSGMGVGRLRITATENNFSYSMKVDTKTSGLVGFFAPLQSVAKAEGSITPQGNYRPRLYSSSAERDGDEKGRRVNMTYDEHGIITFRERVPNQDPSYRPVVPIAEASAAVDPITGFFALRRLMRDTMARDQREASVKTYDAARLATMSMKVVSRARIEIGGKYVDAINTVLKREPMTGYTRKELKKFKEGDPTVHVYFSADARFMPLKITIKLPLGTLSAELVELKELK